MKPKRPAPRKQMADRPAERRRPSTGRSSRADPAHSPFTPPAPLAQELSDLQVLQAQHAALLRTHEALADQLQAANTQLAATIQDLREEVARHGQEEDRLRDQMAQQQALSVEAALADQRERRRLASLLTEELQQLLAAAKYKVALLTQSLHPIPPPDWADLRGLLDEAVRSSRSVGGGLGPTVLKPGDLFPALCWLRTWMAERHQFQMELHADSTVEPDQEAVKLLLFQSVRELLTNAINHAQVARARVELAHQANALQVTVSDDGIGFDVTERPRGRRPASASAASGSEWSISAGSWRSPVRQGRAAGSR